MNVKINTNYLEERNANLNHIKNAYAGGLRRIPRIQQHNKNQKTKKKHRKSFLEHCEIII